MTYKALITGISGQDGSYLAELLLADGWQVSGTVRRNSVAENQTSRISHLENELQTYYADVTDTYSIERVLSKVRPDFVFNLAAQSHVRVSFDMPEYTHQVNAVGAANVFRAVLRTCPDARIYQASSSEMFGTVVDPDGFQRETTQMTPVSPYGIAKLSAFHTARMLRETSGLFISNGILFNHESPRRGSNFVTTKVVAAAARIASGKQSRLVLGNLDAYRDWGHSRDYVQAMRAIVLHGNADDFVVATGQTHSIRSLCEVAFGLLDLDYRDYVEIDEQFFRPSEVPMLKGDASKARKVLGWHPTFTFEELVADMLDYWMQHVG